jgi:hypothetical protein
VKDSIDKIKCVNILYNGEKINNLSVSKIAIWNAGEEAICNKDVPEKGKFRIEIDDGYKILECELFHQISEANNFKLEKINDNIFQIDFDYFNHNEGIVILVYHTATTEKFLNVKGSFINAKNIIRDDSPKKVVTKVVKIFNFDFPFIDSFLEKRISVLILFIFPILSLIYTTSIDITKSANAIVAIWNIFIFIGYWLSAYIVYTLTKNKMPKGLAIFYEDFNLSENKL